MAEGKVELKLRPDLERQEVYLEICGPDGPIAHAFLGTVEAEEFAMKVADARAALADEVPRDLDVNARLNALYDPIWRAPAAHSAGDETTVLALRHPGLGWLSFLFPNHEAKNLGEWLVLNSTGSRKADQPPQ